MTQQRNLANAVLMPKPSSRLCEHQRDDGENATKARKDGDDANDLSHGRGDD